MPPDAQNFAAAARDRWWRGPAESHLNMSKRRRADAEADADEPDDADDETGLADDDEDREMNAMSLYWTATPDKLDRPLRARRVGWCRGRLDGLRFCRRRRGYHRF